MGHIAEYEKFLGELNRVWREAYRVLQAGGLFLFYRAPPFRRCQRRLQQAGVQALPPRLRPRGVPLFRRFGADL